MTREPEYCWTDFGWWLMPTGMKRLLSWNAGTGQLSLFPLGREPEIVLAVVADEAEVQRRLEGWAEHAGTKDGLGWLAQRLEGVR